ncbi:uncharacterized protein DUF2786 [Alkalibaculum bacchi]|uniref:Uncharacterized protein DUF2786 n=1 Tax=Alkalibaculum bacchi TaxID=645887 RepID=A0A366I1I1_9FIRM|nr:DUF2786 domain-containing protein [Alkalibaculum bacchi]RBP59308.1 uncharacterized protein DUF2786 [Alkalibaculum bacchi]
MDINVVEKIKKLLALSESSNEYEAQVAMLKTQELLIKHKLTLREVKEFKSYNSDIKEQTSKVTFTKAKWKSHLARLIADNFGCYFFFYTQGTHTITFFGREEDAIVCNIVLEYAIDCINSVVKKLRYQAVRKGCSTKGIENDYALGFIEGLEDKFEKQKETNQEWGLVLMKDSEVIQAYSEKSKSFAGTINTNTSFQGHMEIYKKGYEDGQKFSISDKLSEGDDMEVFAISGHEI